MAGEGTSLQGLLHAAGWAGDLFTVCFTVASRKPALDQDPLMLDAEQTPNKESSSRLDGPWVERVTEEQLSTPRQVSSVDRNH